MVTDGQSQDSVAEAAQELRDAHVMLYAIGVTNLVNVHQLHQASGPINDGLYILFKEQGNLENICQQALNMLICAFEFLRKNKLRANLDSG